MIVEYIDVTLHDERRERVFVHDAQIEHGVREEADKYRKKR